MKNLIAFSLCLVLAYACQQAATSETKNQTIPPKEIIKEKQYSTVGSIERLDSELDNIIPKSAKIEVLGSGMVWAEWPLWIPEKQWVLCSDVKENRIHKWTASEGFTTFLEPSGFTGTETDSR